MTDQHPQPDRKDGEDHELAAEEIAEWIMGARLVAGLLASEDEEEERLILLATPRVIT